CHDVDPSRPVDAVGGAVPERFASARRARGLTVQPPVVGINSDNGQGVVRLTPLLGWVTLAATWANMRKHAAGPPDYWGSRGRGFESRRPDFVKCQLGWHFRLTAVNALTAF